MDYASNTNNFPKHNQPSLEKIYWQDVRGKIAAINPEFAKLVDDLDPGKKFPLYRAKYPYGSVINREGAFYLPTSDGRLATLDDSSIPKTVQEDFSYTNGRIPAGMVLNNSLEVFVTPQDHIFPRNLYEPGAIFALWIFLERQPTYHPTQLFNITAGTRAIFMLPNIGNVLHHKNLRRDFGVHLLPPKDLLSQWQVFVEITRHQAAQCTWHTELIFFTTNWLKNFNNNDKAWLALDRYLHRFAWHDTAYWRNKIFYDFAFSQAQALRNLRPNPYLADTIRHLFAIGLGAMPGFSVPLNEIGAPIKVLQKAYLESYGLKDYMPTLMHQAIFSFWEECMRPVYYSLRFPTTMEFSPNARKNAVALDELRELQHLHKVYVQEILTGRLKIEDTPLGEVARKVDFTFLHNQLGAEDHYLQATEEIPKQDLFLKEHLNTYKKRTFADAAIFFRGAVRVAFKELGM